MVLESGVLFDVSDTYIGLTTSSCGATSWYGAAPQAQLKVRDVRAAAQGQLQRISRMRHRANFEASAKL